MPEGHTIHQIARDHRRELAGRRLAASSPQGRFAAGAALLDGDRLDGVEAYGKHLFYSWDRGHVLHVHLGLFGRFIRHRGEDPPLPVGAVRLRLEATGADGRRPLTLDLRGPTACAVGTPEDRDAIVDRLGPDPLRRDADPDTFYAKAGRTTRAIGSVLLDQSVIAGLGNVYRAEVLFACRVDPRRPGRSLTTVELHCIWDTASTMLAKGVRDKRIVTVDPGDLEGADDTGGRGTTTYAYRRPICLRCGSTIERYELGNRTCYSCPVCQR